MSFDFAGLAGRWLVLTALGLGLGGLENVALAQPGKPGTKKPATPAKPPAKSPAKAAPREAASEDEEEDFPYKVLPLRDEWDDKGKDKKAAAEAKQKRSAVEMKLAGVLNGRESLGDEAVQKEIKDYFQQYFYAKLTHPAGLTEWPEARRRLKQMITPSSVPPSVHEDLVKLTLDTLSVIAKGDYHPAARYNAAYLIGKLNAVEPVVLGEQGSRRLETPYISAMKFMLDELANPQQIDAVRVAALVGILRHVEIDRQSATRRLVGNNAETRIVDTMVELLQQQDPPAGRLRRGHDAMRRRAADILGHLGALGANGKVVTALDAMVGNGKEPISLRCSAAEALGRLSYSGTVTVKAGDTAKKFAALAAYACEIEIRRVEDLQAHEQKAKEAALQASGQPVPTARGTEDTGFPFPKPAMAGAVDPLAYRIDLTRRRVKDQMLYLKRGLLGPKFDQKEKDKEREKEKEGIASLAKAGKEEVYLRKVADGIDGIISVVDSQSKDLTTLLAQLHTSVNNLEKECEVTVQLPESESTVAPEEKPLANPLDALGIEAGSTKPGPGKPAPSKPASSGKPVVPGAKPVAPGKPAPPDAKPVAPPAKPPAAGPQDPAPPPANPEPDDTGPAAPAAP